MVVGDGEHSRWTVLMAFTASIHQGSCGKRRIFRDRFRSAAEVGQSEIPRRVSWTFCCHPTHETSTTGTSSNEYM